jgi:hypothetical protein
MGGWFDEYPIDDSLGFAPGRKFAHLALQFGVGILSRWWFGRDSSRDGGLASL